MLLERDLAVWDDGSVPPAAKVLPLAFADGDGTTWFGPYNECDFIILHFVLSGTVPTSVEFKFQWSLDGGATDKGDLGQAASAVSGALTYADGSFALSDVGNGDHTAIIAVPRGAGFKLQAQRTGGAGDTAALVRASVVSGGIGALVTAMAMATSLLIEHSPLTAKTDGRSSALLGDDLGCLWIRDRSYQSLSDANRNNRTNPDWEQVNGDPLADVTNGTDGTYYYYISPESFGRCALQYDLDGGAAGAGPAGVTLTAEATWEDDGTAMVSCNYLDITNRAFGVASVNAGPGTSTSGVLIDGEGASTQKILAEAKYVRFKIVADTNGPDTGDWKLDLRQRYGAE